MSRPFGTFLLLCYDGTMRISREKIVGIYHKDCLDGTAAAAVLLKKFPTIILQPLSHRYAEKELRKTLKKIDSYTTVYIVDFSLREGDTEKILKKAREVVNLDHHIGAEEKLRSVQKKSSRFKYIFDNDRSGASLTWIYFYGRKKIPKIIQYVEDVDLFRFSLGKKTRYASAYLFSFSGEPKKILRFIKKEKDVIKKILEKGKILWEYRHELARLILDTVMPFNIKIGGHIVPVHNSPEFIRSDIGNELARRLKKTVATFTINKNEVRLHFRGIDRYTPSALDLAKMLDGGGHRNAAAASVPLKTFCKMIVT